MSIRVQGVVKRYRRGSETVTAVDGATFELAPGEMVALMGPSGSGKTTLLNLLATGDPPDEGTISGLPTRPNWTALATVPQSLGLLDELTMAENVALPLRLGPRGRAPTQTVTDLMGHLGLGDLLHQTPSATSLGEQQRTAVARALIVGPAILLADEPTSHQDEQNVHLVVEAFAGCAADGSAVLVATHDTRVLRRCDRILEMTDGIVSIRI